MNALACYCGKVILLDEDVSEDVMRRNWFCTQSGVVISDGRVLTHLIMGKPPFCHVVDHINRETHDNRKCNLRFATHSQNGGNRKVNKGKSIPYKGVFRRRTNDVWYYAALRKDGILMKLGYFRTQEEAALVYNEKAKEVWGPFALLNEVPAK